MKNVEKLKQALESAIVSRNKSMKIAREARHRADTSMDVLIKQAEMFKADMAIMDADFADDDRKKFAAKLLDLTTRKSEIEAFEDRRGVDIDVMLYDIPFGENLDDWWDFLHDETEIITNPAWQRQS